MLIPNKFNGYSFDGSRRCFGGGGGGGGGDGGDSGGGSAPGGGGGPSDVYTPPTNTTSNTTTPNANASYANFGSTGVYGGPGVSTTQGMATLGAAKGTPWGQSGAYYNDLLNQGFTSNQIRNSASSMYGAPSDANWGAMVQNAAMNSPTGRPMAGSDQFFQPVYNTSYMNYARPATQFDVSTYGTQPVSSPAFNSGMSRGNINSAISGYFGNNPNSDINSTLNAMRSSGINRSDIQQWGGVNNYGPQMSMPQTQASFNPYTNTSSYGGFGGFGGMGGYGGFGQQMQSPFSFQQPSYQPQMQTPFSYQPSYQSSYGGYGSYGEDFGGGVGMYTPVTQQPAQPVAPRSSGPTSPIVGRSAGFRGTPNVMRRAEGGIASLMDKDE